MSAFYGKENAPKIVGGRYGLGSKDITPSDIKAVFDNLKKKILKMLYSWYRMMMLLLLH